MPLVRGCRGTTLPPGGVADLFHVWMPCPGVFVLPNGEAGVTAADLLARTEEAKGR